MRGRIRLVVLCSALALGCGAAPDAGEAAPAQLTLLHTADIHSRIWPFRSRISVFEAELGLGEALRLGEVGGLARLATLLRRERRRGPTLWLDSGDALEGAEVFHRFDGEVELELLSGLGLGALALGNHELSLSGAALAQRFASSASFPVLAANLRPAPGSALERWLLPSALLEVAGVRVGVVGVANPSSPPGLVSPENPWRLGLAPNPAVAVQAAVDEVASRAALIVVLSHLGLDSDRALVRHTTGIDLVLGGHQHILTPEPEWEEDCGSADLAEQRGCSPRRVPIVHSGAYAEWLSRIELRLVEDPANPATLEVAEVLLTQLPVAASVPGDPEVEHYLERRRPPARPPLGFLPDKLGRRSPLGGDSALGDLTTDAVRQALSADVALLNTSGLRADLEAGALLSSDLELEFPFDEPWRRVWLTGRTLRRGLESAARRSAARDCQTTLQVSGLRLRIHCAACADASEACVEIERPTPAGFSALDDDEWLALALPDYLTQPGSYFEALAGLGHEVAAAPGTAISGWLERSAKLPAPPLDACVDDLLRWPPTRCLEALGALQCPLLPAPARRLCATLPLLEGGRDGRVEMLP
jgi:5'-nucleotidase